MSNTRIGLDDRVIPCLSDETVLYKKKIDLFFKRATKEVVNEINNSLSQLRLRAHTTKEISEIKPLPIEKREVKSIQREFSIREEINAHIIGAMDRFDPYAQQYCADYYLGPIVDYLFPQTHPLMRFTIQTFLGYPEITYYNGLQEDNIISRIWRNELSISNFIKSEYLSLYDKEVQLKILSTMSKAMDVAFIGPFLAYFAICVLPEALGGLMNAVILSIFKSILSCMLFQATNDPINFPMVSVAGIIRGIIFYYAMAYFKNLGLNSKDVFYLTMVVRSFFEPQVKKLEKLDIYQFLTRSFSAT